MRIGIVSDTHRNLDYLEKATGWLEERRHIAVLYHLGDDYEDVMSLSDRYIEVVQVPGIYNPRYTDGSLPAKAFETVQGVRILLAHSLEKDVTPEDIGRSDIILYGHTHSAEIRVEDGILYMNPGHLKGPRDKTRPPSFGFLEIKDTSVSAVLYDLDFKEIQSEELVRSENGLYRSG